MGWFLDLYQWFMELDYKTLSCWIPTAIASLFVIPFVLFVFKPFGIKVPVYLIAPILGVCVIPGGIAFPIALKCWMAKLF